MSFKKGFTLVELLAVIAILAILVLLALPNIIEIFNKAKKNSFLNEVQTIYKETTSKYISESLKGNEINKISSKDDSKLNLTGEDMDYCILLNNKGEVDKIAVGNNDYHIIASEVDGIKSLKIEEVLDGKLENMNCEQDNFEVEIKCTYDGNLVQGAEYTNGQYRYIYKKEKNGKNDNSFGNLTIDGWGVYLIDPNSTEPVTSTLCSNINDKPIVSMSYMFYGSKASSIDLSSFDTSKVTNMKVMFYNTSVENLDMSNFDTSKVISMESMFNGCKTKEINVSNFDTSKVTNMNSMFRGNQAKVLDVSNFDTSKVTDFSSMFNDCQSTILDLSNFNTSNATNMASMFKATKATSLDLSSFDTSKVTNMGSMFNSSRATILDLSSFNTSKVTNMGSMFRYSLATTGYAKTQEDADKYNGSQYKPAGLNFVVKTVK